MKGVMRCHETSLSPMRTGGLGEQGRAPPQQDGVEIGVSRYQVLYIEWKNNKVVLYSRGNYVQYCVIKHNGKEYVYIYTHTHT